MAHDFRRSSREYRDAVWEAKRLLSAQQARKDPSMKTAHPAKPDFDGALGELLKTFGDLEEEDFMEEGILASRNPPDVFKAVQAKMKPAEPKGGPSKENGPLRAHQWDKERREWILKELTSSKKES